MKRLKRYRFEARLWIKRKSLFPRVTVTTKGTTIGVATDKEGHFTITPPQDANIELIFSFVGMKPKTITYKGEKDLTVIMEEDSQEMEEVVITGYQVLNKKISTSAISSMKMDDIMIPSASSIDQMLEGRVTDMILMTNSGEIVSHPRSVSGGHRHWSEIGNRCG
ncbi:MAG: carboxypeptidase-like regulatory domain-containing protein [Butyricimonas faecihominis]